MFFPISFMESGIANSNSYLLKNESKYSASNLWIELSIDFC